MNTLSYYITPPKWIHKLPFMDSSMEEWLFTHLSLSYDIEDMIDKKMLKMREEENQ